MCCQLGVVQARAAELLQLHCELRRVMHGRCRALASWAPPPAPLDVLKLLRLWDYEAGLSAVVRRWGVQERHWGPGVALAYGVLLCDTVTAMLATIQQCQDTEKCSNDAVHVHPLTLPRLCVLSPATGAGRHCCCAAAGGGAGAPPADCCSAAAGATWQPAAAAAQMGHRLLPGMGAHPAECRCAATPHSSFRQNAVSVQVFACPEHCLPLGMDARGSLAATLWTPGSSSMPN
jgi:hypothetical protein